MKKRAFVYLTLCSAMMLGFASCNKDDDNNVSEQPQQQEQQEQPKEEEQPKEVEVGFQESTPEKINADITKNINSTIEKISPLMESKTLETIKRFFDLNKTTSKKAVSFFDGISGEYVYKDEVFVFTPNEKSQELVYKYPATEEGTSNNAVMTIKYKDSNKEINKIEKLYPENLEAVLTIDDIEAATFNVSATYSLVKDIPETLKINFVMDNNYKINLDVDLSNRKTVIAADFTVGTEKVATISLKSDNSISLSSIQKVFMMLRMDESSMGMLTALSNIKNFETEITINNISAKATIADGSVINEIMTNFYAMDQKQCEALAEYYNTFYSCSAWFNDTKEKICDVILTAEKEQIDKEEENAKSKDAEVKSDEEELYSLQFTFQFNDKKRNFEETKEYFATEIELLKENFVSEKEVKEEKKNDDIKGK